MATYRGKPLEHIFSGTHNQRSGDSAEYIVTQKLIELLPNDTIVVACPQIGKYDPDLLVLSPRYGIRVIEVKNWSLAGIVNARTNGFIEFRNHSTHNPMQQAKAHCEGILRFLEREFPQYYNGKAPIGYIVIYAGFTRIQLENKFIQFSGADEYWKHHLALDELESGIDNRLCKAAKFPRSISQKNIEDVLEVVQYREHFATETSILQTEMESRLEFLDKKIEQISEHRSLKRLNEELSDTLDLVHANNSPKRKKPLFLSAILIFIIMVVSIILYYNNLRFNDVQIESIEKISNHIGQTLSVNGTCQNFYYDNNSGTKYFNLTIGKENIQAVVFKNTKTPFIIEGEQYEVTGQVQEYKGKIQIIVEKVESNR